MVTLRRTILYSTTRHRRPAPNGAKEREYDRCPACPALGGCTSGLGGCSRGSPASAQLLLQGSDDPQLLPLLLGDDRIDVSAHWHRLFSIAFNQLGNPLNSVDRGLVIL
jgi:hypothetical protein